MMIYILLRLIYINRNHVQVKIFLNEEGKMHVDGHGNLLVAYKTKLLK